MLLWERVLFIDGEALVVDKPAGLPVTQPRTGALSVENHLSGLTFGFKRMPTIVHRLDQDTSGCLLLARNPKAHKRLSAAFEEGVVEKHYIAVLDGVPETQSGTVSLALAKVSTREAGWRMVPQESGKSAVSHWTVLEERDGKALIRFSPETGRTHQLRVHAASGIGLPILGDPVYGKAGPHMMLHASELRLPRGDKAPVDAKAELPPHFLSLGFSELGFTNV